MRTIPPMAILFFVIFVGMMGISVLTPLIPLYAQAFDVSPAYITWIIALYSLAQLIGGPIWGRLGDRHGRRPVLLITMAGQLLGYGLLATADSVWTLILARAIGGFCAGNMATAYAYVTDITNKTTRPAALGKAGAAFSLGFMLGPALGGVLAGTSANPDFVSPSLAAGVLVLIGLIGVAFALPESHKGTTAAERKVKPGFVKQLTVTARRPAISMLLVLTFFAVIAFAVRESIFALWLDAKFAYDPRTIGLIFAYNGVVIFLIQAFAIGRINAWLGDMRLMQAGLALYGFGFVGLALAPDIYWVLAASALNAFGTAVISVTVPNILTTYAEDDERGAALGLHQSTGAFGRFLGPTFSGALFVSLGINAPYWFGAIAMAVAFFVALWVAARLRKRDAAAALTT